MNYGDFLRKLKRYCTNRSINNVTIVNEPISVIIETANILKEKGQSKGEPLYYEISEASRIINNRLDISNKIRDALQRYGMENAIIEDFEGFYDTYIDSNRVRDMVDDFIITIRNDDSFLKQELEDIEQSKDNPSLFLAKIMIKSLKEPNKKTTPDEFLIWSQGNRCIKVIKGDIFTFALGKRTKKKRIVVIPVNSSFDTHVSTKLESEHRPIVSDNTIHGNLLTRIFKSGITEEEVTNRIRSNLIANNFLSEDEQTISLPIGTIATLDFNAVTLYFLAISEFDENNNAHSTKEDIETAIEKMIQYYDRKGQGYALYLPLVGTGMSRACLNYQESFDLIVSTLLKNRNRLSGKINIVIQPDTIKNIIIERSIYN